MQLIIRIFYVIARSRATKQSQNYNKLTQYTRLAYACLRLPRPAETGLAKTAYFILLTFPLSLSAQSSSSAGNFVNLPDSNTISYSLTNNTSVWRLGLIYQGNYSTGFFSVREFFETTRLESANSGARWKDDQKMQLNFELPVTNSLSISAEAYSNIFKDRHTGLFNDVEAKYVQIGIKDESLPFTKIGLVAGPIWDSRREQNDAGYRFHSSLISHRTKKDSWNSSISADLYKEDFNVRKNESSRANVRFSKEFYESTSDSFYADFKERRYDYYISESGEIESRIEELRRFGNNLRYKLTDNLNLRWSMNFIFKETRIESPQGDLEYFNRKRKDELSENRLAISFAKKNINGRFSIGLKNSLQKYSVSSNRSGLNLPLLSPDNEAGTVKLSSFINYQLTNKDSISFRAVSNRLRYDTPDSNNFDDRDEIRLLIESRYEHRFESDFSLGIRLLVNLNHIVYLFGERSADNHWNRVFSLSSEIKSNLTPKIKTVQSFGVLANYFDYDFDDRITPIRSLVLRKFRYSQSTIIEMSRNFSFLFSSVIEIEEDGKLNWDKFIEQRTAGRVITSAEGRIKYRVRRKLSISGGLSRSSRTDKRFLGISGGGDTVEKLVGIGPVFHAIYRSSRTQTFVLKGKIQRVENRSGIVYYTKSVRLVGSLLF